MEDADQIELKEATEVPVSDKLDLKVPDTEGEETLKAAAPVKDFPEQEEELSAAEKIPEKEPVKTPEKAVEKAPEKAQEKIPEKTQAPDKEAKTPSELEEEQVNVDAIIQEEVVEKPKEEKKPKKIQKKKPGKDQKAAAAKPTAPEKPAPKEEVIPGLEDEELTPDLVESMKAQEAKPREAWKILFSGLDFAGKSSIIATVKNEFEKIVNPQPTKLTERSEFTFLGQSVHDWDMGGQRLYRIQYLKRPMVYYADTSVLFYVIDVLDEERYDESIDFLYDTLQLFDKLNVNPLISILFHKYDPDVERDSKKNRIELKITALTNKIKVLAYGRDVLFFRTSIFNKFSVIEAFSRTLLQLFPDKNLVDYALAELAQKTGANIIIILDESRLILGKNIVETADIQYDELVKLAQNTLLSFLYLNENFQFYPFLKSNYLIIQLEKYSFLWSQIDENGHSFYIIVFKDGANFNDLLKMDVQSVAKTLIKLIKKG